MSAWHYGTLSRRKRRRKTAEEMRHGEARLRSISNTLCEMDFINYGSQHIEALILNGDVLFTQAGDKASISE
jgi:hypothetical protein